MRVFRNTEGAVMVIAVFMAAVTIGCLYYLSGLGDAILAQERMQDAADAAAFSSAVIHARGMNLLALINIIMASLLAILVLLSMLHSLFKLAARVLMAAAFLLPAAASGVQPMRSAANLAKQGEEMAKPEVEAIMAAMHKVQGPLRKVVPVLASVNAAKLTSSSYAPVVTVGTTFPILQGLPTEDGEFETLCKKAGSYAGRLIMLPLMETLGVVGRIVGGRTVSGLSSGIRSIASSSGEVYARFYCGDGPKPPPPKQKITVTYPKLDSHTQRNCARGDEAECERYEQQVLDVRDAYDAEEGICKSGDRELRELCDKNRRQARRACNIQNFPTMEKVRWRRVVKIRKYHVVGEGNTRRVVALDGAEDVPESANIIVKEFDSPFGFPLGCERPGFQADQGMTKWEMDPGKPLCQEEVEPPDLDDFGADNEVIEKEYEEITDVLNCFQTEKSEVEISDVQASKGMKESKPQEMCNCAAQGEEMFQIRSIVLGSPEVYTSNSSKGILVATYGREVDSGTLGALGELGGRFAVAQAEFYFDSATAKRSEWLWSMEWKARMRRLSFGRQQWECPERTNTCESGTRKGPNIGAAAAQRFEALLEKLEDGADAIIVH
ncbi:MAG: hypothetical protein GY811_01850 [Myxococcales bacterium]|nr:hypothetical protein [Myxococcales bacterium]